MGEMADQMHNTALTLTAAAFMSQRRRRQCSSAKGARSSHQYASVCIEQFSLRRQSCEAGGQSKQRAQR